MPGNFVIESTSAPCWINWDDTKAALASVGLHLGEDTRHIEFLPGSVTVRYGSQGNEKTAVIPWVYGSIRTEGVDDRADSMIRLEVADSIERGNHNRELTKQGQ